MAFINFFDICFALYDAIIILAYILLHICLPLMMIGMKSRKGRSIEGLTRTFGLNFYINQPCKSLAPKSLKKFSSFHKLNFDGRKSLNDSALFVSDDGL